MDNFKIIYKILKILEKSMDLDEFDSTVISHEALGVTENRRNLIIEMLIEQGYVKGANSIRTLTSFGVNVENIRITLKGLEYLEENSFMKKAGNLAKGIIDVVK